MQPQPAAEVPRWRKWQALQCGQQSLGMTLINLLSYLFYTLIELLLRKVPLLRVDSRKTAP